ncbi:MAG: PD40 domain-containing protein, partial [Bacteroidia bacterium]|nr:PD40 domain-containing protein [Bacteroidia bacterium]
TGGQAKLLSGGLAYEGHPRFSPDGKLISFTSDRSGGDNIWIMNADGTNPKQISSETFRLPTNAVFTPDGQYLIARKHYTGSRSAGAGEMWMWHISGGDGLQLTKRKNDQQDAGEPEVGADGKYVYWSEDMTPGGYFQYNKDPNGEIYQIRRLDRETGEISTIAGGPGGTCRPQISPDGKTLAFVKRVREKTVLYLKDLKTGEEWPVYDALNKDMQETWAIYGVYPNFAWMPDNSHIIIWAKGGFQNVDIKTYKATSIPFKATVKQIITEAVHSKQQAWSEKFESKSIRQITTSPDGKMVVFNAAGYLYKKNLPSGTPERLTTGIDFEYEPAFSPDGKNIYFITWNDSLLGAVVKLNTGLKTYTKITTEPGYYFSPAVSPDGKNIAYRKGSGNEVTGFNYGTETGIYTMPSSGGKATKVRDDGAHPQYNNTGDRLFFASSSGDQKALKSCDLKGGDERIHFTSKYATQISVSPDNNWVAFTELFNAYVAAFPKTGNSVDISSGTKTFPVYKISKDAGNFLHWNSDSKFVNYSIGSTYFSIPLKDCFKFLPGAPDSLPDLSKKGIAIGLEFKSDLPSKSMVFTNARIITMKGDEIIENGYIIINQNKIVKTGAGAPSDEEIKGMKVMDCSGKTIMPGLVDVHAHIGAGASGMSVQKQWSYYTSLAYGITTTHDPSNNSEMIFSQAEMQRNGTIVAPRLFSTGTILYGAETDFKAVINSLDDARMHLRRLKALGAFSVKSYNQPRRDQRQQVLQAARELDMLVVPEGGSHFQHNMSMIADGHTGIEHSIPVSPLYKDVSKFWSATTVHYTPTLIVSYGGIWGENYFYQKTNVWENEKLLKFYPRALIDSRSRRRTMAPDNEFNHIENAKACSMLADSGVKVNLGAHGQIQGIGAHWEMQMMTQGGMSNHNALKVATINGAQYIGMGEQLGSIEPGKYADLMIMDKNPLDSITFTQSISYVMINGWLFNAATMQCINTESKNSLWARKPEFWFDRNKSCQAFEWHEETQSFMHGSCSCNH